MKKRRFLIGNLLLICLMLISGCGKTEVYVDVFADVKNGDETLNTSKNNPLTVGDVYAQIRKDQNEDIVNNLMKKLIVDEIKSSNNSLYDDMYKKILNKKFNELFVEDKKYSYNNEFNEQLVIDYMKNNSYAVYCDSESVESSLLDAPFTCQYNDYIEKELDYDIYLDVLKIKYVLEEKTNLIDKYKVRHIKYYSISTSDSETTREEMENYVDLLVENYNSTDPNVINSIQKVAEDKRKQKLKEIDDEFKKLSTSDDSDFKYLDKFTKCGEIRCKVEDGKTYWENQVEQYYKDEVVTKDNTEILYESARNVLFSDSIEDYLYKIGSDVDGYKYYLISPVYINDEKHSVNDIILFNNVSGAMSYYLVEVEIITSNSADPQKIIAAEAVLDKISDNVVLRHYLEESKVKIYDKELRELFISIYGDYSEE